MSGSGVDSQASDAELVERCIAREPGAWEQLVHRYASLVYSVPRKLGLRPEESEDVSQSVFASLLTAMEGMRDRQSLAKWLITVATRQSWRVIDGRRASGGGPAEAVETIPESERTPDLAGWERRLAVRRALGLLGGRCQELLLALFSDRGSPDYQQVAERLGMPIGSIGPTRNRCLRKLLEILASRGGVAGPWDERERALLGSEGGMGVSRGHQPGT